MHDKSQAVPGPAFGLPGYRVITLDGRDAAAFAQAQFMNDVNGLQPDQWHWNGWLTPKGRVLALFALLRWSDQQLWLLVPDADAGALADGLGRFLFRSKVAIKVRDELRIKGRFAAPEVARANSFEGDEERGVELDMGGDGGARCLVVRQQAPTAVDEVTPDEQLAERWKLFDLEHGLPRLPASQVEHWTPQQLSLQRLRGFSVQKGCYPGQEIVARTHFLGKAKRGLALLEADAAMDTAAQVRAGDTALGSVIASVDVDGRHVALAVLSLDRGDAALEVAGHAARSCTLKGGLER